MKKVLSAFLIAFILTAAGCGNNQAEETTQNTTKGENGKVTNVVYENPVQDTTKEALVVLEEKVPLFAKYLKTRMSTPMTVETSAVLENGSTFTGGVYIKDEVTAALTSNVSDGTSSKVIYSKDMAYQIDDSTKTVYYLKQSEDVTKDIVGQYILKIDIEDVNKCTFERDTAELDGVTYNREIVHDGNGGTSEYYFDTATDNIRYIKSGENLNKFEKLENAIADESIFEIPADYEQVSYEEFQKQLQEQQQEEQAKTE